MHRRNIATIPVYSVCRNGSEGPFVHTAQHAGTFSSTRLQSAVCLRVMMSHIFLERLSAPPFSVLADNALASNAMTILGVGSSQGMAKKLPQLMSGAFNAHSINELLTFQMGDVNRRMSQFALVLLRTFGVRPRFADKNTTAPSGGTGNYMHLHWVQMFQNVDFDFCILIFHQIKPTL